MNKKLRIFLSARASPTKLPTNSLHLIFEKDFYNCWFVLWIFCSLFIYFILFYLFIFWCKFLECTQWYKTCKYTPSEIHIWRKDRTEESFFALLSTRQHQRGGGGTIFGVEHLLLVKISVPTSSVKATFFFVRSFGDFVSSFAKVLSLQIKSSNDMKCDSKSECGFGWPYFVLLQQSLCLTLSRSLFSPCCCEEQLVLLCDVHPSSCPQQTAHLLAG